jgi:hypothetical protein
MHLFLEIWITVGLIIGVIMVVLLWVEIPREKGDLPFFVWGPVFILLWCALWGPVSIIWLLILAFILLCFPPGEYDCDHDLY